MLGFFSPDPVALHASLRADDLCCLDLTLNRRWTYREFDNDIQKAITFLTGLSVTRGCRVAIAARNSAIQILLHFALMRMGATFIPLNWRLSPLELANLLERSVPTVFFRDDDQPPPIVPSCCVCILASDLAKSISTVSEAPRQQPPSSYQTSVVLYTSGTSGMPKGAKITPVVLMATAINFGVLGEVDSSSVFLCDSPMFHVIGLAVNIWSPLLQGGSVIVSGAFNPVHTNNRLSDESLRVTHYFCVPQMAEALHQADNFAPSHWKSLKALFTGGAPYAADRIRWWLDQGISIVEGYGMTETGTTLGMPISATTIREKAGSVGVAGPLTAVRIVDQAIQEVPVGTPGELLVSGPNVIAGYWNNSELENRAYFTDDGWFRTGDIARRDQDGFIFLVDRKKDVYISGGENIYPTEIESVLLQHSGIMGAAVIGIPDPQWGEVGRAYVIPSPSQNITKDDLVHFCEAHIGRYKIPKEFILVRELPRTGSGKILKRILKDNYVVGTVEHCDIGSVTV